MTTLALLLPLLALGGLAAGAVAMPKPVVESLILDNGLDRGEWGQIEICTDGSYVYSFEIKYSGVGFLDDTSVNAIRLLCETTGGTLTDLITSSEGSYGQWVGMRSCPFGEFMTGVRANVVPDMGSFNDDLGMDNLQMKCSGGEILDGQHEIPSEKEEEEEEEGPLLTRKITQIGDREVEAVYLKIQESAHTKNYGEWGAWRTCSPGNKVCGLQVRLEDDHALEDDAGVTDVIMYCCN